MPGVSQRIITVPSWRTAGLWGQNLHPHLHPKLHVPRRPHCWGLTSLGLHSLPLLAPEPRCPRVPVHIVPIACPRCAPPLATAVSMGNVAARLLLASCSTSQGCGVLRAYFTPWAAAQPDPPVVHKPTESHISGSQLPGRAALRGSACPRLPHVALPPCPRNSFAGPDSALVWGAGGR